MKLSIVVPVYNTRAFLSRCLDSLLGPGACADGTSETDYEVIAVNDGSTDDSADILEQYRKRYPDRLRVIETPNGGLGHARNTGISVARGEYLAFVDSDDYLSPGAVGEMLRSLKPANGMAAPDIVVFDFVHVDGEDRELAAFRGCAEETSFSYEANPAFLFSPHNAVNKLWRRTLFTDTEICFPDRLWFEDLATVPKLYLHAGMIQPVHRPWYRYYQRQGSIMLGKEKLGRNAEMTQVIDQVLAYYDAQGARKRFESELTYKFWYEEFLASVTRVNRIDPKSPVQDVLRDDYLRRFPDSKDNSYVRAASKRLHLLDWAIRRRLWPAVHAMTVLNNKSKGR